MRVVGVIPCGGATDPVLSTSDPFDLDAIEAVARSKIADGEAMLAMVERIRSLVAQMREMERGGDISSTTVKGEMVDSFDPLNPNRGADR